MRMWSLLMGIFIGLLLMAIGFGEAYYIRTPTSIFWFLGGVVWVVVAVDFYKSKLRT